MEVRKEESGEFDRDKLAALWMVLVRIREIKSNGTSVRLAYNVAHEHERSGAHADR